MMATYYAQRASAGLIVSEATQISRQGQGYSFTPGIYTEAQVQGWRRVTNAVHTAGGRMVLQLWHVGRMSHPSFHADGLPVAPSALSPEAKVWVVGDDGVEIHGANGYLIDQFLRTTSNHRTDAYGGTMDNRTRFAREVAAAVASEGGAERTGTGRAPVITQRNMNCPEIIPTLLHLARQLDTLGLAPLHP